MSYVLFYSNYCKYSSKFISILEKSGEASFFAKVCVDKGENNQRPPVVAQYRITEVPSIIVGNQVVAGYDAFVWLQTRIENSKDNVPSMSTRSNKQGNVPLQGNAEQSVSGVSPYAQILPNITDNCVSISGSHAPLHTIDDPSIEGNFQKGDRSLPSISCAKDTLKEKQFDNEYNKMLAERDASVPQPERRC